MATETSFQVQLATYQGPLDLLLYLVRKEELPIAELPLADVAQQYLDYVAVLEKIDPNAVGEFLDIASLLLEMKSHRVLPSAEHVASGETIDEESIASPSDLVQRLLEFKEYRDAAERLESLRLDWSRRYTRPANTTREAPAPHERPIEGVELWDLVSAFARLMRDRIQPPVEIEVYEDPTPIADYMAQVAEQLRAAGQPVPFEQLFTTESVHKTTLVAMFLSMLELIRYRHAVVRQTERYGAIFLELGPEPFRPV